MKFYISTKGIKRVTISNKGSPTGTLPTTAAVAATRRTYVRTIFPLVLVLGIVLPFMFVRVAFLVLDSATVCSSSLDCIGWRFLGGSDTSVKLREELTRALLEAKENNNNELGGGKIESSMESFDELVKEMMSNRQDIRAFTFKTKATLLEMEQKIQSAKLSESFYWHLASLGVPKSLHCFSLKLAEEYAVNAMARSCLPPPEYVSRLTDSSFHHIVLLTDHVLAASVVVSSAVQASINPEKLVFHIITDKKTYAPMHAWFSINFIKSAVVEVKGLHQYDWSQEVNVGVKEMLETHCLIWEHQYNNLNEEEFGNGREYLTRLETLSPGCFSLMNHLRIYIPELFPDLNKIVFLDDDIVVQHDISPLWDLDLRGKVVGAVNSWCGDNCCPGRKYKDFLNFSHPIISSKFDQDRCSWLYGMNIFDLQAWRRADITATYHHWLKLSLKSGLSLWRPGALPPALIAFEGQVHPIDPSWHVAGLGHRSPELRREIVESAAVIHFSGPAKPWLGIGFPELRSLWNRHVNCSNKFIRKCQITK